MLTEDIPDTIWKKNFRMVKITFEVLARNSKTNDKSRYEFPELWTFINAEKNAAVWCYLKETGSLWMTGNAFFIHQCTVSKTIIEVSNAIILSCGRNFYIFRRV